MYRVLCRQREGKVKCKLWEKRARTSERMDEFSNTHIHTRIQYYIPIHSYVAQRENGTSLTHRTPQLNRNSTLSCDDFPSECVLSLCHKFAIGLISFSSIIHIHKYIYTHRAPNHRWRMHAYNNCVSLCLPLLSFSPWGSLILTFFGTYEKSSRPKA